MTSINHTKYEQILRIEQQQFAELLLRLLQHEAYTNSIPLSGISVPLNITVADGGQDGTIQWDDGVTLKTDWLPSNDICFQIKATNMSSGECKNEILTNRGTKKNPKWELKSEVKACFDRGGTYVLFLKQHLTPPMLKARINKFREGIEEAGESYSKTAKIEIFDANKIALWVNQSPAIVAFVCEVLGLVRNTRFKTFGHWKSKEEDFTKFNFVENEFTKRYSEQIKSVSNGEESVLRINGLSGLGKTRLIFDFFDGIGLEADLLKSSVLYYDASNDPGSLVDEIAELSLNRSRCNLIIDNCPLVTHNKIKKELKGTRFNLLTTDSDPTSYNSYSEDEEQLLIEPSNYEDLIPVMLNQLFPEIRESDIRRIQGFAQGFPLIAVLLAKQYQQGSRNLGQLTEDDIVDRLLGIDDQDKETRMVLRTVSLFEFIGFYEDFAPQRDFLATYKLITPLNVVSDDVAKGKFFETCENYRRRGLIEKKGRQISLRPKPLALRLAREWWENLPENRLNEILEELTKNNLSTQLCDQIAKLDFVPKAKELTEKLCGNNGPFGQAEVLNTNQGSRLFRSLVEVNPEAAVSCLMRVYSNSNIEELQNVQEGRRNIIWSLEKLSFRSETFERAAGLMFLFSLAENEKWGNNATNQFLHLFHIHLAGTEANLQKRLNVIKNIIQSGNTTKINMALSAIKSGVKAHGFSRMGGAEKQGSSPSLIDHNPTNKEVVDYWQGLLNELEPFLYKLEYQESARKVLASAAFNFAIVGAMNIVLPFIQKMANQEGVLSEKIIDTLKSSLRHERNFISKPDQSIINSLIEKYEPNDIESLYRKRVARPNWDDFKDSDLGYSQQARKNAEEFAIEFLERSKPLDSLPLFYASEQQEGYYFGAALAKEINSETERMSFIEASVDFISKANFNEINPMVFNGFLSACSDEIISKTLDSLERQKNSYNLLFVVMRSIKFNSDRVLRVFDIIDEDDRFTIEVILNLRYSFSLRQFTTKEVMLIAEKLSTYGAEGNWIGLLILDSYCYQDDEKWEKCKPLLKSMLQTKGLLKLHRNVNSMEIYSWETLVIKILAEDDVNFVKHIAGEVLSVCDTPQFDYGLDSYLRKVILFLFEQHFEIIWPIFGEVFTLEGENYITFFNFKHLIGSQFGFEEGVIFKTEENQSKLLKWINQTTPEAVRRMAQIMPVLHTQDYTWHPFAKTVIDNHGNDKEILSAISSNLGTYSWSGSSVPLYQSKKKAFEQLLQHPIGLVREWATSQISYCEERIKHESNRDEERFL